MPFAALGKAEPLILTAVRQKFDLWPRPMTLTRPLTLTPTFDLDFKQGNHDVKTRFLAFDLDLWPTTLAYNPILVNVKVDPHAKNQGLRSNGSAVRAQTDGQTDGQTDRRYQVHYLPRFAVNNKTRWPGEGGHMPIFFYV